MEKVVVPIFPSFQAFFSFRNTRCASVHRNRTHRHPGEAGRPPQRDLRGSEQRVDGGASKNVAVDQSVLLFFSLSRGCLLSQRSIKDDGIAEIARVFVLVRLGRSNSARKRCRTSEKERAKIEECFFFVCFAFASTSTSSPPHLENQNRHFFFLLSLCYNFR